MKPSLLCHGAARGHPGVCGFCGPKDRFVASSGDSTYVGRYETAFDYWPSAFSSDQPIPRRLTKHILYFDLPNKPEMRMSIVYRATESGAACGRNRWHKWTVFETTTRDERTSTYICEGLVG
jgi:hypothetical protein